MASKKNIYFLSDVFVANQEKLLELVSKRYPGDVEGFLEQASSKDAKKKAKKEDKKKEKKETVSKSEEKQILQTEKEYKEALAYIKDAISPAFLKVHTDKLRVNNTYVKTFFVYAYPNFLEGNWLSPIINWDVKFDMSLYVYPIESAYIQKYLKKRLTQLYSERSINAEKGLINDPGLEAQIQDVEELRGKLTRGIEKYFHFGLYITIYSDTEEKLNKIGKDIETILAGRNVLQKQSFLRAEQGFITTGPFAKDELGVYRNIST